MNFLLRYGNFFLFLILELYAISLVGRYNKKQNEIYQSSANLVSGVVMENFSTVRRYFSIQEIADSLAQENARLKTEMEIAKYVSIEQHGIVKLPLDTSAVVKQDSIPAKLVLQQFHYTIAEIVNNSIVRNENYITINRGKLQGVKVGNGVISATGIIGIVRNVTDHYAQVMSVLHKRTNISAMIKRNRNFGSLVWHGGNPHFMTLESITKYAEVAKGDSIVTSGFSEIFPGNVFIGRVADFKLDGGSNFYAITIELNNDIAREQYVYVIDNLMIKELEKLKTEN